MLITATKTDEIVLAIAAHVKNKAALLSVGEHT